MPAGRSRHGPCLATVLRDAPDKVRDQQGSCGVGLRAGSGCFQPSRRRRQHRQPALRAVRGNQYSRSSPGTHLTHVFFGKYAAEQL